MDIDDLCETLETSRGLFDGNDEWNALLLSGKLGIGILSSDVYWIRSSQTRYKKYLRYLELELTDNARIIYHLLTEFVELDINEHLRQNKLPLLAAKIIVIDKTMHEFIDSIQEPPETIPTVDEDESDIFDDYDSQ